ncbi:MAG: alpha/beta hydrolase [Chlorobi bacterium]|nr:alpha/beta hydrolase [Chlorobiota bacterium]
MITIIKGFGTGTPIVFLPPFPFDSRFWQPIAVELNKQGIATQLVEYAGSGIFKDRVPKPYSLKQLAESVVSEVGQQAHFAGLSMGGYVAFHIARYFPKYAKSFIFMATHPFADSPEQKENRDRLIKQVKEGRKHFVLKAYFPSMLAQETYLTNPEITSKVWNLMTSSYSTDGLTTALESMKNREDLSGHLSEIDQPTTVIFGKDDSIISNTEWAEQIPNARVFITNGGHLFPMEHPAETIKHILNHIEWAEK